MNMFEMFVDEETPYEFGEKELNSINQKITYTSDTLRASYIPRKDIIECGFLQDDVKVYLTFISTDVSDFSESFSNEALTAIMKSDSNCAEKFEKIFNVIFGVNFDRAVIYVPDCVFSKGSSSSDEVYVSFYVYYYNTQINIYFSSENGSKSLIENMKIKELANKMIDYDARLDYIKNI